MRRFVAPRRWRYRLYTSPDMVATVLYGLGIDHKKVLHTPLGRPVPTADGGNVVRELFA